MTTKKSKRALAWIMALCMCLSMVSLSAFADGDDTIKYVALGDMFTNGAGLTDYYEWDTAGNIAGDRSGFMTAPASAYPSLLAETFGAKLSQLAITNMRAEDLNAVLDPEEYLGSYFEGGDDYFNRVFSDSGSKKEFKTLYEQTFGGEGSLSAMSEAYRKEIADADVITICIGASNMGRYFIDRLGSMFDVYDWADTNTIDGAMKSAVNSDTLLNKQMKEFDREYSIIDTVRTIAALFDTSGDIDGKITDIKNALYYAYAGFALNFKAAYKNIREINPNAELIIIGLPNVLDGLTLNARFSLLLNTKINMGDKFNFISGEAKAYMKDTVSGDGNARFVDMPDVQTFFDELKASGGDPAKLGDDLYTAMVRELAYPQVNESGSKLTLRQLVAAFRDMDSKGSGSEYYKNFGEFYSNFKELLKLVAGASEINTIDILDMIEHAEDVGELLSSDDLLAAYKQHSNEDWAKAVLYIYSRYVFGEGMANQPNAAGHRQIADTVAKSGACFGVHDCTVRWSWADDLSSATCELLCKKNDLHKSIITDSNIRRTVPDNECRESFTASVTVDGQTLTDTVSRDIAHSYSAGKCIRCGAVDPDYKPDDPSHEHSYTSVVTVPTCIAQGYTTHTCPCGDSYEDNYVDALGHDYVNGICTRCGASEAQTIVLTDIDGLIDSFKTSIMWAVERGITTGYDDGTFRPNATCTRGHVVTFLWRAAGSPEPQSLENPFSDVSESSPFFKAILWAAELGITTGYDDGTFRPNAACTRAHVVTFLWRYEGKPAATGTVDLVDLDGLNADFTAAIKWAASKGITTGYADGTFRPNAVCTRAHVVTFLQRDLNK